MKKLLVLLPILLVGCGQKSPEEAEAAKYPAPKMMTESEAKAQEQAHPDPRTAAGGSATRPAPGTGPSGMPER